MPARQWEYAFFLGHAEITEQGRLGQIGRLVENAVCLGGIRGLGELGKA